MTFWPDTRFDGISTDAKIARSDGLRHRAWASRLQHRRSALRPHRSASRQGIYTESAVALVLSGIFEHLSDSRACMAGPGSLVFANKRADFSCRHQGPEGNRRIVVFFSEELLEPLATDLRLDTPSFRRRGRRLRA